MARRPFVWAFRGSALRLHSSGRAPHSRRNGLRPPLQSLPHLYMLPSVPPNQTPVIPNKASHPELDSGSVKVSLSSDPDPESVKAVIRSLRLSKGRENKTSVIPNKAHHPELDSGSVKDKIHHPRAPPRESVKAGIRSLRLSKGGP